MAMTRKQREAAERLRKNNEYLEEKYSGKGTTKKPVYKTREAETSSRPGSYKTSSQVRYEAKKATENSYAHNAARNNRDRVNNVDPYAWQKRTGEPVDFKPIWGLTGIFDALDQIKKDKERKADSASLGAQQISSLMKQQGGEIAAIDQGIAALSPGLEEENATKESALKTMLAEDDPVVIRGKQAVDAMANGIVTDQIKADAEAYRKLQEQYTSSPIGNQMAALNADKKFYSDAYDAAGYQYAAQGAADYKENVAKGAQVTSEVNRVLNGKYTPVDTLRDEALGGRDTAAYITMTQDEIDTYRYWLAKNKEVAYRYIKHLKPQLIERASDIVDQNIEDIENEGLKKVVRGFTTAAGSGKNVGRAIRNIPAAIVGSEDVEDAGIVERGQQKMMQRLEGVEKGVNDFIYNMIPMIPTAAVSMVPGAGAALSAGYTAARSFGGTYADTIQQGYAPGEAQRYALANAASEAGMQYLLGGIAKTGGEKSLSSTLQRAAGKAASNPAAAKGLAILGNMGSEAAEEYLQANLDPVLRNIILDENNELNPVSQDKWEAAVMGALMSLVMNAPSDISEGVQTARSGRAYNSPDVMQALVQEGLASGPDTQAYGQAQRLAGKLEAGKNVSNSEAGSLAQANEAAIAAEARANAILDKTGVQRAYDPNETVKLADGREVVIVARDGSEYTAIVPGESGYTRITIDEILHRESARRAVDAYLHPEDKADITGKYDYRHVEKTADQAFLDKLEQGRGIKAVIEDMQPGAEALYDRSTNTIHFAPDSTRADVIGGVAAHELSHAAEDSKHYKAYSDYALQKLFGNDTEALRQAVEAKQEQYIRRGIDLSDAEAVAEIVADYTRSLYKSEADIEALVTGNRSMAQGIYDSIKTAIRKIRAFFKGDEAALANIREYQDLRRAQRMFEKALSTRTEVQADMEAAPAYALIGNKDGKDIFISNFPDGTPKNVKQQRVVDLVQNAWQHKPIGLTIYKGGVPIEIQAKFDPSLPTESEFRQGERSDLSKIAFGNRKGTMREQRLTLDLADDLYYIAQNSKWVRSKKETGKDNPAHEGVTEWHYFINDIYYRENGKDLPYTMNIDVKEKADGNYFYSFGLEKTKDTRTEDVLSSGGLASNDVGATRSSEFIIPQTDRDVNRQYSVQGENSLEELTRKYGEIESGEKPVRDAKLPRQTKEDRFLSKYARTLYEANATNDSIIPALESKIEEGEFSRERISNKRTVDRIQKIADTKGIDSLQKQWDGLVSDTDARIAKADDIAVGQFLYNEYVKAGDYDSAIRMAVELSTEATRAGQTVQAFRILKKLSPDGQLYAMEQMADKINRELAKKLHDKAPTIEIDSQLERNLLQAKTKEEINSAVDAIKQNIADQMPATWVDKLNAWRYLSMLGNPRTHIRNIVGNAIFVPVRQFKNLLGAGLEHVANVDQAQRTKSLLHPKKDKPYIEAGQKSFHDVQDILKGNEKYGTGDLNERRTIFKTKLLEAARKLNFKLLEFGDMVFMRSAYVRSYAQAMKARGLSAETMTATQERSVSEYAMNEALKATYRDYNALAAALNKFKRSGKVQTLIGEGLFPFTKTPLNVLKRGVEYSPAGVAKGIYEALHDVRNGVKTASEAIDTISAGLSGTGVMALGAFLAAQGLIVGGSGDDDNEAALDKLTGGQNYAIQIGDKSYTIDWAAPVSMPLFVGVELYNTMQTGNAGASFKNILDSLTKISDPLFNLSMLSSINSAIEAAKYSGGSPLTDIGINIATSYAGQFIPTALGQFARITDDTVRKTYYDKNSGLPKAVDSLLQGALKKIPGASTILQPSVDRWGREIKSGSAAERVLENLISPGYYSERNVTNVDKEIDRLYQQIGDSSVIPPAPSKYIKVNGERIDFSAEEYTKYSKLLGQAAYDAASSTVNSKVYARLTDREKAEAIGNAYDYARETAMAQISEYKPKKWVEELQGSAVNKGLYFSLKAQTSKISNAYDTTTGEKVENTASLAIKDIIDQTTATDGIKKKLYGLLGVNKTVQSGKVTWDGIDRANLSWGDAEIEPTTPGTQSGTGMSTATTIPEAQGYELPNYKAGTLEKISAIGVSPEDYAYIDDRIDAKEDKVAYLQELGFDGKQLSGLVESFVMGKTAKDKMRVAEEDMNIDNGTYIDAYIFGYSSVGSKSERNAQIREYVNGLPLSDEQKDALYNWVKVSRGKTADGKQTGGSSGGSGRRGSRGGSGGKSAGASQAIPDSVWNEMRSNVKTPTIQYDNPAWGTLKALLDRGDKIREETMQRELAAVDATPYMSSEWRAERKREIRKRYERGMMA